MCVHRHSLARGVAAVLVVAAGLVAASSAFAATPEVAILMPGMSWQVYDATGSVVSAVTIDDVVTGLSVVAWRVDPPGGGVGALQTGSYEDAEKALQAEFAKGAKIARGHFLDRAHSNFSASEMYEAPAGGADGGAEKGGAAGEGGGAEAEPSRGGEGGPPGGAGMGGPAGEPGGPGGPPGKGAPGGKKGPGGAAPPGGGEGAGAAGSPPGGGGEDAPKKGLPIIPIGIGAVVVIAVVLFLLKKRAK